MRKVNDSKGAIQRTNRYNYLRTNSIQQEILKLVFCPKLEKICS